MLIKIAQTVWRVNKVEMDDFGQTDPVQAVILLNQDQQSDQMRDTLLHEVLHAIIGAYGVPMGDAESEEAILKTLTPALMNVLCENPSLVQALTVY